LPPFWEREKFPNTNNTVLFDLPFLEVPEHELPLPEEDMEHEDGQEEDCLNQSFDRMSHSESPIHGNSKGFFKRFQYRV
jgi:hypothetical protein